MNNFFYINPFTETEPEPVLKDVFPNWLTNGIFKAMADNTNFILPWAEDSSVQSTTLDLEYFGNHSGGKFCAPIVKMLLDDGELSSEAIAALANIILTKYNKNWKRLWDTYVLQYTPDNNYKLNETRTLSREGGEDVTRDIDETHTGTTNLSHGLTTETEIDTEDSTSHGRSNTYIEYQYGFNEDDQNEDPAEKSVNTEGGTTSVAHGGTETKTNSGNDITTLNLADNKDDSISRTTELSENELISRTGKIGEKTIQSIITEDRELWMWNYFETIFNNVDDELTLSVYDACRV